MELLFAFYNVEFAKEIKKRIQVNGQFNVMEIVSSEEDLLSTIAQNSEIEGVLLTTDLASKMKDQRLEVLVDIIAAVREKFPNITFTILSNEGIGHPMLAELVELGIYNIFVKNGPDFTTDSIMDSFTKPLSFNTAVKYRQVDPNKPWRRNLNKTATMRVEIHNGQQEPVATIQETEEQPEQDTKSSKKTNWGELKNRIPKKTTREPKEKDKKEHEDWLLDDLHSVVQQKQQEKIIGTVVIGVTSVAPHLGSTHTAISMARHLSELGHMVALVEGNYSQDFDRIHSLYEGEKNHIFHESKFDLNGIEHFKYRDSQNLSDIFSLYEYVVLDLGELSESMYLDEFKRSHVKCIVCSAEEWKYHWIEQFQSSYGMDEQYNYLVPGASTRNIKDLMDRMDKRSVYAVPIQESPYEPAKETGEILQDILGEFLNGNAKTFSKNALIFTSVISISVTIFIGMVFWFLS